MNDIFVKIQEERKYQEELEHALELIPNNPFASLLSLVQEAIDAIPDTLHGTQQYHNLKDIAERLTNNVNLFFLLEVVLPFSIVFEKIKKHHPNVWIENEEDFNFDSLGSDYIINTNDIYSVLKQAEKYDSNKLKSLLKALADWQNNIDYFQLYYSEEKSRYLELLSNMPQQDLIEFSKMCFAIKQSIEFVESVKELNVSEVTKKDYYFVLESIAYPKIAPLLNTSKSLRSLKDIFSVIAQGPDRFFEVESLFEINSVVGWFQPLLFSYQQMKKLGFLTPGEIAIAEKILSKKQHKEIIQKIRSELKYQERLLEETDLSSVVSCVTLNKEAEIRYLDSKSKSPFVFHLPSNNFFSISRKNYDYCLGDIKESIKSKGNENFELLIQKLIELECLPKDDKTINSFVYWLTGIWPNNDCENFYKKIVWYESQRKHPAILIYLVKNISNNSQKYKIAKKFFPSVNWPDNIASRAKDAPIIIQKFVEGLYPNIT